MAKSKYSQVGIAFRDLMRELRLVNGLTQTELAKRIGVPQSYVSKYETGERRLDFPETVAVCSAMGVSLGRLVREYERRRSQVTKTRAVRVPGGQE